MPQEIYSKGFLKLEYSLDFLSWTTQWAQGCRKSFKIVLFWICPTLLSELYGQLSYAERQVDLTISCEGQINRITLVPPIECRKGIFTYGRSHSLSILLRSRRENILSLNWIQSWALWYLNTWVSARFILCNNGTRISACQWYIESFLFNIDEWILLNDLSSFESMTY